MLISTAGVSVVQIMLQFFYCTTMPYIDYINLRMLKLFNTDVLMCTHAVVDQSTLISLQQRYYYLCRAMDVSFKLCMYA